MWVQVAEAGFGDRLAELGWKQVSPAHWRLDGDGVIWRTMLGRAPEDIVEDVLYEEFRPNRPEEGELDRLMAGCFADQTGFELAGLDDLIKRLHSSDRDRWLNPMLRKGIRAHLTVSISTRYYDASRRKALEREEANWSWWDSFKDWLGFYQSPHYDELQDVEPAACGRRSYYGGWWNTTELGVEEVAARLTRHWDAWIRPKVASWMTAQDALGWHLFTVEDPDSSGGAFIDIYANYVAGNFDYCRRRLRATANTKIRTVDEELERLAELKFFDRSAFSGCEEKEKRETAEQFIERDKWVVSHARNIARTLDLTLD